MYVTRLILALLIAVFTFGAQALSQTPGQVAERLAQYQTIEGLSELVQTLRENANIGDSVKTEADKLCAEATMYLRAGESGEARQRLLHGLALLQGLAWNEREKYVGSLTMRTDMAVTDASVPFQAQLTQSYLAKYEASNNLQLHVWISDTPSSISADTAATAARLTRQIGVYPLYSRDLIDHPFRFDARIDGMADGLYRVMAEVLDDNVSIGNVGSIPVYLVRNLQSERAAIEKRLAAIQGHESTKATIRYPFDLARSVNLNQDRPELTNFDFVREMRHSAVLLQALESGADPLWQSKGDHKRHYFFKEAGEIMPYRVYVPEKWDTHSRMPLITVLHGGHGDEDTLMDRDGRQVPKLAEQHGYIVVSPFGYRVGGAFGNPMRLPAVFGNPTREGREVGDARRKRILELSEEDVMNVLELVASEYGVDRSRVYLAGHSMGSGGTWHLGAKYAERWAAIAPLSGPFIYEDYPFDRIKNMPIFYTEGTQALPSIEGSRVLAKYLKENGFNVVYMEVDGTHGSMVEMVMPKVFEFLDKLPAGF